MRISKLLLFLLLIPMSLGAQNYRYYGNYRSMLPESMIKNAGVKSVTIILEQHMDGHKDEMNRTGPIKFDDEGRMTFVKEGYDETDFDETIFSYDKMGRIHIVDFYSGGKADPEGNEYDVYEYTGDNLISVCNYGVDIDWETGDTTAREWLNYCTYYFYDNKNRLVFSKNVTLGLYERLVYDDKGYTKYELADIDELANINSAKEADRFDWSILSDFGSKKYDEDDKLVEDILPVDEGNVIGTYTYHKDGRIKEASFKYSDKGKPYVVQRYEYKKGLLQSLTYDYIDENGMKDVLLFEYKK